MLTSRSPLDLQLFTKYPFRKMNSPPLTMPEHLKGSHFVTGIGKIFHGPWKQKFDQYISTDTGDSTCGRGRNSCVLPVESLIDDQVAARALWLIDQTPTGRPWMSFVGFHRPHWMYSTSPQSYQEVEGVAGPLEEQTRQASREGALDVPDPATNGAPRWSAAATKAIKNGKPTAVEKAAELRKWVFASTQWMDKCLGRIMDGLKARNQWNNTIVVFTADNGVMLFDRGQSGKSVLFRSAKRVPLLIRHPDYPNSYGKRTATMAELMDIYPSILEMADLDVPSPTLQGVSLKPIFRLLNSTSANRLPSRTVYETSVKLGAITIETRCAEAVMQWARMGRTTGSNYTGGWIACHQLNQASANTADMFGISFQTAKWNYIEWRVAQWRDNSRQPRWDTAALWGRELYSFENDDGFVRINGMEFESKNLAPCRVSCFPRSLNTPPIPERGDGYYKLPGDEPSTEFDPPDLQFVDERYRDVVRRLSLAVRALVRDKRPVCSGHGTMNPITGECDECIPGWTGSECEIPRYPELSTSAFPYPFPPTPQPTNEPSAAPTTAFPTFSPTISPSYRPTTSPIVPSARLTASPATPRPVPTRFPTRYPTKLRAPKTSPRDKRRRRRQQKRTEKNSK